MSFEIEVNFALNLLSLLEDGDDASSKSIIFSPASILNGLAMIYIGSNGETEKELTEIIGKGKTKEEIIEYFSQSMKRSNNNRSNYNPNLLAVTYANQILVSKNFELHPQFSEIMKNKFEGGIQQVNFKNASIVALKMNNYVRKVTNNQILSILSQDAINPETSAMVINILHFIGPWDKSFDKRRKAKFYSPPNSTTTTREIFMMHKTVENNVKWNFIENQEWDVLGIPYKSREAWMYIVLPKEIDGLPKLLKNISVDMFKQWTKKSPSSRMHVTIPLMNITTEFKNLNCKLESLGIKNLFSDHCDLSKMFMNGSSSHKIEKFIHKTIIQVDEEGTVASSVSVVQTCMKSAIPKKFKADHPFLYFITTNEKVRDGYSFDFIPLELLYIGTFY